MKQQYFDMTLSMYTFFQEPYYIAWCPAVDISGYGQTKEKAQADLVWMLDDYLKTQMSEGTLQQDLEAHGWKDGKAPSLQEQLRMYPDLADILTGEHSASVKHVEPSAIPA